MNHTEHFGTGGIVRGPQHKKAARERARGGDQHFWDCAMRASSCFRPTELGGCSVASEVFNAASEARRFSFFEKRWGRSAFRGAVLRAKILHARAEVSMAAGVAGAKRGPLTASTGVLSCAVAKDAEWKQNCFPW
jgi:hypothetical protein